MPATFRTFSRGQPYKPRANWLNTGNEVFEAYLRSKHGGGAPQVPGAIPQPSIVRLKNITGDVVPQFGALGIGDPILSSVDSEQEFKRIIAHEGDFPRPMQPFAVLLEPLGIDKIGRAVIQGATVAKCNFPHDKLPYVDGDGTTTEPEGVADGHGKVLWKETGTGSKWAVLLLGAGPRGHFPVTVEKDGGSDGTVGAVATWTYTVRTEDWAGTGTSSDYLLATARGLSRPRPKGKMLFQAGSTGFGDAFYGPDGTLRLWDAGEVPDTGVC